MEISPLVSAGYVAPVLSKAIKQSQSAPTPPEDGYSGVSQPNSPPPLAAIKLPKLAEPGPQELKRGYLWQAVPLPGPIDAILGAVLSFGPIPGWLGLEPAPKARPEPTALAFSWNAADQATFATQVQTLEGMLRDPEAVEIGKRRILGGTNDNYLVTLSNGAAAIWTPKAGERSSKDLRLHVPPGSQAEREEAAYLVDRRLGHLGRVPPAVSSGLEGREGSLKLLVSQGQDAKRQGALDSGNLSPQIVNADYRRIAIFDHVIGNLDRHSGNYLLDAQNRPIPIDHGLAFPTSNGKQGFTNFHFDATFALAPEEKATLEGFLKDRESIAGELKGLLEPGAIAAMFERVERMLELGWVSHEWRQK